MNQNTPGGDKPVILFSGKNKLRTLLGSAVLLIVSALAAMAAGAYDVSIGDVVRALVQKAAGAPSTQENLDAMIIWQIRLPRILLAVGVGASLATAGAVFQACFRNPLVEPYILGVSAGSAFGAALGIVFPQFFLSIQVLAFVFGAAAVFSAYSLATVRGETPIVTLILAGVIIGSIGMALVSILKYISDDTALREIVFWFMGGFYYASWTDVAIILPPAILGILTMWRMGWKLNVLSMGEEESRSLGVHPERYKLILIIIATLITALSVSAVGIIAWVGLMMPHAARMLLGPDHRYMIPMAALMGAIYLIWCDTLARTMTNAEIPVGIITSISGAPYLIYLLRTKGKKIF